MALRAVSSSKAPEKAKRGDSIPLLGRDDIGYFSQAVASSRGQFSLATKAMCEEFELAPRGPFIIGLLGRRPRSPYELADFYGVGRSLITAELSKLSDAGLIEQVKDGTDGRRVTLSLTPAGWKVYQRLGEDMGGFLAKRLSGYTRDEIMLCARMLSDFAKGD
jgi:DNA-binding MarR family transcriptional regulator